MSINAVFFDLDGTLLDTAQDLANALNRLLVSMSREPLPVTEIRRVVSNGAYAMLKLAFGLDREHPETASLRQALLDHYLDDLDSHTSLFPGLDTLLKHLDEHDIQWGIVTNKPRAYAEPLIENFPFHSRPVCLVCPDDVSVTKPHPEPLQLACKIANCEQDETLYIGDHLRDIECGRNAGIKTIAVNYGYIDEDDSAYNWNADHVVETGDELWPIVKSYLN